MLEPSAEQLCAQGGSHLTCVTAYVGYARDSAHESVVCRQTRHLSSAYQRSGEVVHPRQLMHTWDFTPWHSAQGGCWREQ